jgi:cell division protein FtsL
MYLMQPTKTLMQVSTRLTALLSKALIIAMATIVLFLSGGIIRDVVLQLNQYL